MHLALSTTSPWMLDARALERSTTTLAYAARRPRCGDRDRVRRSGAGWPSPWRACSRGQRRGRAALDDLPRRRPRRPDVAGEPVNVPAALAVDTAPIDPVASPDAYRRELLVVLGEDDPAVGPGGDGRAPARDRPGAPATGSAMRPEPREWSVIECLGHLVDSELVASARMRWILAEDEPDIVGYDQDRWVDGLAPSRRRPGGPHRAVRGAARREPAAVGGDAAGRPRALRAPPRTRAARATGSSSGSRPATIDSTSPRPSGRSRRCARTASVRRPGWLGLRRRP